MKRWIHASKDLTYEYEGETYQLPTWCYNWSDEEIAKAKAAAIDALKNPKQYNYEEEKPDPRYTGKNLVKLKKDLAEEGFTKKEIDEIVWRVQRGETLDSAMQSFFMSTDITASDTRDRISYLEERIDSLENRIASLKEMLRDSSLPRWNDESDDSIRDRIADYQQEIEELSEQLNFAWQDDEAEYNYAVEQQEFNPDGSLKLYGCDDITASYNAVDCELAKYSPEQIAYVRRCLDEVADYVDTYREANNLSEEEELDGLAATAVDVIVTDYMIGASEDELMSDRDFEAIYDCLSLKATRG